MLGEAATTVAGVKRAGDTIELVLRIPPDGRTLAIESLTDAFHFLFAPLVARSAFGAFVPSALTTSVEAALAARGMSGSHRVQALYPELASRYVRSFALDAPPPGPSLRLEESTLEQAKAALEAPWPTARLRIVATDPMWIAHLDLSSFGAFVVEGPFPKPVTPVDDPSDA